MDVTDESPKVYFENIDTFGPHVLYTENPVWIEGLVSKDKKRILMSFLLKLGETVLELHTDLDGPKVSKKSPRRQNGL